MRCTCVAQGKTGWQIRLPKDTWLFAALGTSKLGGMRDATCHMVCHLNTVWDDWHAKSMGFWHSSTWRLMLFFLNWTCLGAQKTAWDSIRTKRVRRNSKDWITIRKEAAPSDSSGAKSLLFSGGPTKKCPDGDEKRCGIKMRSWYVLLVFLPNFTGMWKKGTTSCHRCSVWFKDWWSLFHLF